VKHVSRLSGLLRLKASRVRVFQSDLKTGGGSTAGGSRGIIVKSKLNSDGSMRRAALDHSTLRLLFLLY
jgi:hypothetical protein